MIFRSFETWQKLPTEKRLLTSFKRGKRMRERYARDAWPFVAKLVYPESETSRIKRIFYLWYRNYLCNLKFQILSQW